MIENLRKRLREAKNRNDTIVRETSEINVRRFFMIGAIAAPISLGHIVAFWLKDPANATEASWRTGILLAHLALMLVMLGVMVLGHFIRTKWQDKHTLHKVLHIALMAIVFAFGITITAIDQLVLTNVTPFIMASLVAGVAFYTRPRVAIILYSLALIAFAVTMAFVIPDESVRVSNQVNGLTIAGLGLFLSIIVWQGKAGNITQHRMIQKQQDELKRTNEQLDFLATHDVMTGLLNRTAFTARVEEKLKDRRRRGCLIMIDLDHFKRINDSHGHPVGDELLKRLSADLKTLIRQDDLLCRWGGEEFLAYAPNISLNDAVKLADTIRTRIAERTYNVNSEPLTTTISCGVTDVGLGKDGVFHAAYERADKALYRAKDKGRNRVEYDTVQRKTSS